MKKIILIFVATCAIFFASLAAPPKCDAKAKVFIAENSYAIYDEVYQVIPPAPDVSPGIITVDNILQINAIKEDVAVVKKAKDISDIESSPGEKEKANTSISSENKAAANDDTGSPGNTEMDNFVGATTIDVHEAIPW